MAYQRTPYVESKRAEARDRLLLAGLALIAKGGWRELQMSAVAAAAGLSTGALYLHFPSKTDLMIEMYRRQAGVELRVVAEIADRDGAAIARLDAAIRAFSKRAMSRRRLAYAMVLEPTAVEVEEERLRFHAQFIEQFARILDAGVSAGEFALDDPQIVGACIFGSIIESLMRPLGFMALKPNLGRARAPRRAEDHVDHLVAFCLRGVGGSDGA